MWHNKLQFGVWKVYKSYEKNSFKMYIIILTLQVKLWALLFELKIVFLELRALYSINTFLIYVLYIFYLTGLEYILVFLVVFGVMICSYAKKWKKNFV